MGVNKWHGVGNLGADAELRVTSGGQSVLKFSLACSETYKDRNGQRQDRTEWVRVTLWGKRAEALAQHLTKGKTIYVEGRLQTSSYEKDGEKRYSTEINASEIEFVGGGGKRDAAPDPEPEEPAATPAADDDSIPF